MIGANLSFQIDCVFAEYDLFKPIISIQNFGINLTQFYINYILAFTPFQFPLQSL